MYWGEWSRREDSNTPSADYNFGCSAIELHRRSRRVSQTIPTCTDVGSRSDDTFRRDCDDTTMNVELRAHAPLCRERHVESRHHDFLEPVANLELAQRGIPAIAIVEEPVGEMGDALGLTDFNRLGDKGIGRSFVRLAGARENLNDGGDPAPIDNFQESDQLLLEVRTDVVTVATKRCLILLDLLEGLAVVHEASSLSERGIIVQIENVPDEVIVDLLDDRCYASLLCPAHVFPTLLREFVPPVFEACGVHGGHALPLKWVSVSRHRLG